MPEEQAARRRVVEDAAVLLPDPRPRRPAAAAVATARWGATDPVGRRRRTVLAGHRAAVPRRAAAVAELFDLLATHAACTPADSTSTTLISSIAAAPGRRFECIVGRTAHYAIGIVLAYVFVALVPGEWLVLPTLLPALLYGIGTLVFPLFIMQPAFGLGFAGARTPKPAQTRLKSLMTHTVFGFGLWGCAVGMNLL